MKATAYLIHVIWILAIQSCKQDQWIGIYDGQSTLEFDHYLGIPDSSIDLAGLKKDCLGNYIEGLGLEDSLEVFSIANLDGENVISISGQVIGGLILSDILANYHLRLKFKWGDKKWDWMQGRPKDGGILYHQRLGYSHELQIHEGDVGSYWA